MNYHERLKQHSPAASELEQQKRRMSQGPTIEEIERRLQEAEQATLDASNYLGYPSGEVPVMRDEPPSPPENVIASPFFHQLDVSWSDPRENDHVIRAFVRVKLVSDPSQERTIETPCYGGFVVDLPVESHAVEAAFEDRWGRASEWSAPIEATPSLTVAESIDFTQAQVAGALGWENLAPLTDPANLGDDVVLARAMATQNLAATRLWAQVGAFESAMIKNLAVDKLMAGIFTAGQIILAGAGSIKAGQTTFSSDGLVLPVLDRYLAAEEALDAKISASSRQAHVHFYRQADVAVPHQGIVVQAEGIGPSIRGNIMLQAFNAQRTGRAYVGIGSSAGSGATADVYLGPSLVVEGKTVIENSLRVDGFLLPSFLGDWASAAPNGGTLFWNHNLGVIPRMIGGQQDLGSGRIKPLPAGGAEFGVFVAWCTATQVCIQNNEGIAWLVRPILYK